MKRNEMVTVIENIIETELTDYPNSYPGNRTVAEIILLYMEQAGMSPPFIDKSDMAPYDIYFTMHVSGARYPGVFEWEPENET